jgi:serine/threonine protein kinase
LLILKNSFGVLTHKLLTGITPYEDATAKDVFMNILINDPLNNQKANDMLSSNAKSLIKAVLTRNVKERATIDDIMKHPFFEDIDWNSVLNRELVPPYLPERSARVDPNARVEDYDGIIHL